MYNISLFLAINYITDHFLGNELYVKGFSFISWKYPVIQNNPAGTILFILETMRVIIPLNSHYCLPIVLAVLNQREHFLSEVNKRETILAIEANNDTYCLQKGIEKFPQ